MELNSLKKIIKYRSTYSGTKETDILYKKYFIKLKQSLKNINASEFRDLWILECKNVFNLNREEALQELTIITEELNEDELRKSFFQNEVNIEIKRENPDVVNKLDLFSIHFDNLTSNSQLLRIVEFINTMMYANTIKPKKTKEEQLFF